MPERDRHSRRPDSETKTSSDSGRQGASFDNDQPIGSSVRALVRTDDDRPCLDLAVDNGTVRRSLREVVDSRSGRGGAASAAGDDARAVGTRLIEAQEDAARRIAQSLHDEASQMLAIVYLELASIARNSPAPTAARIDRVIQHLDSVCEQIRGLSHELHPMVLERHGLMAALQQLSRGLQKRAGLDVRIVGTVEGLSPSVEAALYRIVQEALSNVLRHACASKVDVRLRQTKNRIFCSVRDDGIGFDPADDNEEERYESGLGLVGICERVDCLGGECHILSGGRKGTELKVGIPI